MIQAALLREVGTSPEVVSVDLQAPGPGQVQVRVKAAGLCQSDLSVIYGKIPQLTPLILGHEGAGVVEQVGEGVTGFQVGEHVIFNWVPSCGHCWYCEHERTDLCEEAFMQMTLGTQTDGSTPFALQGEEVYQFSQTSCFAEQTVVPENALVKIDRDLPFEVAAVMGCAVLTGFGAVKHTAQVTPGSTVAVIGCGGVGLNVIQTAKLMGATTIIAMDRTEQKLQDARDFGATHTLNPLHTPDLIGATLDLTDQLGVDFAFEVVGRPETIQQAYGLARKGGKVIVVGVASPDQEVTFNAFALPAESKVITGSWYGQARMEEDIPEITRLYQEGKLKLQELISHRYPLEQLHEAIHTLEAGEARRIILLPGGV
ncbi:Zn-dependent alcohol dehydrogenase [Deinococcus cellulosilyticus]|uniref:Alcohol dehydrogenase n=1 Tax=Deinococcus cellulosilyticus (strain DSM 18568 / NBRC 106333 / KACC 11606 / 5516J-15) TaxID=1223518 RepID=A0A511N1X0_DEIC1|nr:Zn-dependent alcohol dehydrogenase [Deinococcus cellulosilyticus]GEM46376.1 alcohol dehydrogenase [Deinococcus cellulosilyticus NBRC 106333 = KACC 11606]